jgi:hypothetical protein
MRIFFSQIVKRKIADEMIEATFVKVFSQLDELSSPYSRGLNV